MENTFDIVKEKEFLNSLVVDYKDQSPYSKVKKDIIISEISKFLVSPSNKNVLQLGCSNGYETELLAKTFRTVDVVDGSSVFIDKIKASNKLENVRFIHSLFEEYRPVERAHYYDYIFCNYILEHVFSPVNVLATIKSTLKPGGLLFAVVPNAHAFSRKLANRMGIINDLYALTKNDHEHGHRRTYTVESIEKDFTAAGFSIQHESGIIFKILADFQLNNLLKQNILTEQHILGLQSMGAGEMDSCDSILIVGKSVEEPNT